MRLALNWGSRCYCFDSSLRKFYEGYRLIWRMKIRVAIGVLTMGLVLEPHSRVRPKAELAVFDLPHPNQPLAGDYPGTRVVTNG